jgi:hypothetical protein
MKTVLENKVIDYLLNKIAWIVGTIIALLIVGSLVCTVISAQKL